MNYIKYTDILQLKKYILHRKGTIHITVRRKSGVLFGCKRKQPKYFRVIAELFGGNNMNNTQLKKYISILYDMELNNYLMTEMISRLDSRIYSLGRKKDIAAPKKAGKDKDLIPIGYMHEFIRLGIATHLEGADGLYYLVRNELRADQFQCSIEEISCKLDTVIDKQREIYGVISDMNHRCDYLVEQTKKSIKLSAQNNALLSSAVEQTKIITPGCTGGLFLHLKAPKTRRQSRIRSAAVNFICF